MNREAALVAGPERLDRSPSDAQPPRFGRGDSLPSGRQALGVRASRGALARAWLGAVVIACAPLVGCGDDDGQDAGITDETGDTATAQTGDAPATDATDTTGTTGTTPDDATDGTDATGATEQTGQAGDSTETTGETGDAGDTGDTGGTGETGDPGDDPDARFGAAPAYPEGEQTVEDPFIGVRLLHRTTTSPRPLNYHVALIDPAAPGIDFRLTPANGDKPRETTRETALEFIEATGAQLAINAHFFSPWPAEDGYAALMGLGVSDGDAYSAFDEGFPYAFVVTDDRQAAIVEQAEGDTTGLATTPALAIDDAVGAAERIVTAGVNTATWEELHPRTAAGITATGLVAFIVVDGRQQGKSEGMTTPELADVLIALGVVDALNFDGGGSSTLVVADPTPRTVNTPVGYVLPGTLRDNGSNLAVFATPR